VSSLLEAPSESVAHDVLEDLRCTDGLPIVVPTQEKVDRMVLAGGLDPDIVLGMVAPRAGVATVEAVAANAVMAGCTPDHFPVVIAAVQAVLDPEFDLAEVQATTNPVSPLVIVNGPARHQCGIASGYGALGPGHRANATIGRALRLVLMNIGGARPGDGDMALLGHGSKFTACLGEAEEVSPFEPLHVHHGWLASESVVTVVGADAPQAVACERIPDHERGANLLIDLIAGLLSSPANVGTYSGDGCDVVIINPNHAQLLYETGFDRARLTQAICDRSVTELRELRQRNPATCDAVGGSHRSWADDALISACKPDRLAVLVAGGAGCYSWVLRSWGVGPHRGSLVSRRISIDDACEVFLPH
jgi:hypothetical protein